MKHKRAISILAIIMAVLMVLSLILSVLPTAHAVTQSEIDELRKKRNAIVDDYAKDNKVIHQLIDLALLQNGMLTGASLDTFIKRSVSMIKE